MHRSPIARSPEASPESHSRKIRVSRKLTKRLRHPHRLPSTHLPERFRHVEDAQEDVTAPTKGVGVPSQYMNQSIFSMIAAAGSRTDFHTRFDESSDSEEEDTDKQQHTSTLGEEGPQKPSNPLERLSGRKDGDKEHQEQLSKHKVLKSLPKSSVKSHRDKQSKSRERSPSDKASPWSTKSMTPRDAPMLSRMLTAQAEFDASSLSTELRKEAADVTEGRGRGDSSPATLLAVRLMEIFGFDKPEKVIAEYPCWLLQSVLLQGYMYITQLHICFYAYLPKKSNVAAKTGHLSKRGRKNPKFNRYWFTLKGDVLSYYSNPSDLYFPRGNIDLRYGISASLSSDHKENKDFSVTTDHRTYHFRADSVMSAKEWVKTLQKMIFRSHNDGDSVKISLPIESVIDVEEASVVEFAETFKIRLLESGESYAIDEYFFSFFSSGKDVLETLSSLINDTPAQQLSHDFLSLADVKDVSASPRSRSTELRKSFDVDRTDPRGFLTPPLRDSVRATLMPRPKVESSGSSPRLSGEFPQTNKVLARASVEIAGLNRGRASFDYDRRSRSTSRLGRITPQQKTRSPVREQQGSSDSYVQSLDRDTGSSVALNSVADTQESMNASQILDRSDVFHSPTIDRLRSPPEASGDKPLRSSEDTARPASAQAGGPFQQPSGYATDPTSGVLTSRHASHLPSHFSVSLDPERRRDNSSSNLQDIIKAGSYPLQRAGAIADYLKSRSSRMSRLLASESMGYYEKVSGMWAGGKKHYGENEGVMPENKLVDPEDEEANVGHGDRFRAHFALPATEKLQATYFGYLIRVLPLYGKIYISNKKFCFRSLLPGTKTKVVLPLRDIENVDKEKGFRFGYQGLVLVIRGHEELFFEFNSADHRDDCTVTLLQSLEAVKYLAESKLLTQEDVDAAEIAKAENDMLQEARRDLEGIFEVRLPHSADAVEGRHEVPAILFDDPRASILNFKPTESFKVTCLTIGSRGDVQPYIALCKGLLKEGHRPRIATHAEFEPWVRKHGIDFAPVEGDPAELMRICVENGMFTFSFMKEASLKFRSWIEELLSSAWKACQDTDILLESPSAMAGIHIAEALCIPYFRAFTMPWTRTRAYPHAFAVPEHKIGGAYNYFSYIMFDNVFWKAIAGQVNRWRKRELGLRSTNLDKMQPNKIPFLYNFSPHVVVPPLDYSDWVRVTGYWFLDEANDWTPPEELTSFIAQARKDSKKLVYIGFGSIVVSDPAALTRTVVDSVLKADVRCILSKGWSDRLGDPTAVKTEIPLPPEIHQIKSAPHDWLFKQIDAAAHHGGAGTTGASLRAGLPTIIKPFFGDQFFYGGRVEDLGVGICLKKVNVSLFSRALWEAVHSERMIMRAKVLGEQIRQEDGVETAIQCIYRDLEYAKTLVNSRNAVGSRNPSGPTVPDDALVGDIEESWTFIGAESDPELKRRIESWDGTRAPRVSIDRRRLKVAEGVEPTKKGSRVTY